LDLESRCKDYLGAGGIRLAGTSGVTPDNCPLCGTSVALLRGPERRSEKELLHARIVTLRNRADQLERGAITPRSLKDEALWMCAPCQGIMVGISPLERQEIRRRIHDEARRLERRRGTPASRAS
jgi:hypothetical protein